MQAHLTSVQKVDGARKVDGVCQRRARKQVENDHSAVTGSDILFMRVWIHEETFKSLSELGGAEHGMDGHSPPLAGLAGLDEGPETWSVESLQIVLEYGETK